VHLLVGLGNPGGEYRDNRHNIGFMAADAIAARHGFAPFKPRFQGLFTDGTIDGERVMILKPQTFMNRSGDSVAAAANFFKIDPHNTTVLYDELDLMPGKLRVKIGGGNGGHNGLRSIDPAIGKDYRRVRLGIGHPGHKDLVTRHVLGDFAKSDRDWLDPLLAAIADNAVLLVRGDDANFMNKIANATAAEPDAAPAKPAAPRAQSHIRQARAATPKAVVPENGPLAGMLRKLFNKD